ncbi:hypothetical protein LXA43DRAFT_969457 [Ganoderma leucocontextum]|nr:hypothetical protein LXA43DRAFT_969457 [Ganoderma leucocontextum]
MASGILVATVKYLADRSSIPVPPVLAHTRETGGDHGAPCYALFQKGVFPSMTPFQQNIVITTIAKWMVDLYDCRFNAMGSLSSDDAGGNRIGPVSAKAYYGSCAQRELDSARTVFAQDAPVSYQHQFEDTRLMVERITGLMCDLTNRCQGLDEDDPEMTPFQLKNIYVSPENHTHVVRYCGVVSAYLRG